MTLIGGERERDSAFSLYSRNISDCSHFLILVSIRTALLTNIKFGEGCLFFAMFIVKIRLHKAILNFHRRMARDVSRGKPYINVQNSKRKP